MAKLTTASVPAPTGGLNARDSLVAMEQTDAIVLENWWPQPYGLSVRRGYQQWATGLGAKVDTLATYTATIGSYTTFAWAGTSMFDVTTQGPVGLPVLEDLTNAEWQYTNFVNAAGNFMLAVNGADDGIVYNGTTIERITLGTVPLQFAVWTGLDPKLAIQLTVHQHRVWAVEKNSARGWYSPVDALQGEFTSYDFGPLFNRGGNLSFLTTWTIDDGNGAEDHLVAVSINGEAVVFGGTNPNDPEAWRLVGVYFVGAPVAGRRSYTKAGGDLLFLTQQGVVSMSGMLVSTKVKDAENPLTSKKIQHLLSEYINKFSSLPGWAIIYYPRHNMLIINVPSSNPASNLQLAANQIIGVWTTFTRMAANCWGAMSGFLAFGGIDGTVYRAWEGFKDNVLLDGSGGTGIIAKVQQAYSYMGNPAKQNQVGMYRPVLTVGNFIGLKAAIQYDFEEQFVRVPNSTSPDSDRSDWDVGHWDIVRWDGGKIVQKQWIQAVGMGVAASLKMVTNTEQDVLWVSTDYTIINGEGVF